MLDLDVYASRDILRDLTQRGIIVRTSEQKRGTAVKYGPGAQFPWDAPKNGRSSLPRLGKQTDAEADLDTLF